MKEKKGKKKGVPVMWSNTKEKKKKKNEQF
jgi:hypothetical protein